MDARATDSQDGCITALQFGAFHFAVFRCQPTIKHLGAVGIEQTRHAIPAGFLANLTGLVAWVIICYTVI